MSQVKADMRPQEIHFGRAEHAVPGATAQQCTAKQAKLMMAHGLYGSLVDANWTWEKQQICLPDRQ